jgi:peptidoglycan/xylan/chitin deacetylase (PgdA/CDA1 family)
MRYFVSTPWWLKKIYPTRLWNYPAADNRVYLTFDDGPHPIATRFVLSALKEYNAEATFFCIGKNVLHFPEIYQQIIAEKHQVGNHSYTHPNGWSTGRKQYNHDIIQAAGVIQSSLFRPPYGRLSSAQARDIKKAMGINGQIVMWSILSGDFDRAITAKQCINNVTANAKPGSIIVFHDSERSFPLLKEVLPAVLANLSAKGFVFAKIPVKN